MEGCGHCGYPGALESKGEEVKADSRTQTAEGYGEFEVATIWTLYRCPRCAEPTLGRYIWADMFSDPESTDVDVLYPKPMSREALPPNVTKEYDLALRGRGVDPAFYALGVRRTLEAICTDEGITGNNLSQRLTKLADGGRLPQDLADLTSSLRKIGNFGAHAGTEVPEEEISAVGDLMEALLEYLYRAPAKLAAVRQSFAARGASI